MGLFGRSTPAFSWNQLTSEEDLNRAWEIAQEKPIVLFKHSTRCSISAMALRSFQHEWKQEDTTMELYLLDLIAFRSISNEIAERTGVQHQSPQVIVLFQGKILYHASHESINASKIQRIELNTSL